MVVSTHSIVVSKNGSIFYQTKSRIQSHEKYNWVAMDSGRIVWKMWCNKWKPRYLKLQKADQVHRGLGSRCSDLFSLGMDKISSTCGIMKNEVEGTHKVEYLKTVTFGIVKRWSYVNGAAILLALVLWIIPSADAVDVIKTYTCLLNGCRFELLKCISNPSCAANIACLEICNNSPDETECQIKCGDMFQNSIVEEFNNCAVSRKKCVPHKSDVGNFPVPDPSVLVHNFNINDFTGKWFITSGMNPIFDIFDCQAHEFHTESNKLVGKLTWRIRTPDTGFFTRSAIQKFVQDTKHPGILHNHDNEYLHYQDDWYIISSKIENEPDDYIFVYYRGKNDAWDEYGGAVVYTRSSSLPESIVPELQKAAKSVGRDFNKFINTDNKCGPEPTLTERLEKLAAEGEKTIVREVEEIEGKVANAKIPLFQMLVEGFQQNAER